MQSAIINLDQFNISDSGQFILQRKIFSDIYPDFPDLQRFKLYVYLCKAYQWKFQRISRAKSEMQKDLNMSRGEVDKALDWLESNFFIKRTNSHKQQMYQAKLLTAPDYDPFTQTYVSCEDIPFYTTDLKARNQGYIMIPAEAISNDMLKKSATSSRTWSYTRLKVYIMLYAHFWLSYFGGIDPSIVTINASNQITYIEPAFYFGIQRSKKQVTNVIEDLISMNLFKRVDTIFEYDVYVGDADKLSIRNSRQSQRLVLRPYHISSTTVNKLLLKGTN